MKNSRHNRTKKWLWIGISILVLAVLIGVCAIYLANYYHADMAAIEAAFPAERGISEQTLDNGDMVFSAAHAKIGLIFYPGGKVEHTAYIPLMRTLAKSGLMPLTAMVKDAKDEGMKLASGVLQATKIAGEGKVASLSVAYAADNLIKFVSERKKNVLK